LTLNYQNMQNYYNTTFEPFDIYVMLKDLNTGDKFYAGALDLKLNVEVVSRADDGKMKFSYKFLTIFGGSCYGSWTFKDATSYKATSVTVVDKYQDCFEWSPKDIRNLFLYPYDDFIGTEFYYFYEIAPTKSTIEV